MGSADRFFFAVFSLFRFSINAGLLERPLVAGALWGVVTGDYVTSLNIAVFFELFWLDNIPAGTYIPPHILASTFAALALTTSFGFTEAPQVMFILLACLPLARLGAWLENALRQWHNRGYYSLLNWARRGKSGDDLPRRLVVQSILRTLATSWLFFWTSTVILHYILSIFFHKWSEIVTSVEMQWSFLWIAASLGGLLALRLRKAYATFVFGVVLFGFVLLAGLV
ncbi:PTS system, mannose-specific IIC component [Maridesulfovibrio ferrireducens]|uniref:PTS system, mannose-specific IIC component n=1 Tax=Maridesulfovibrio ferrireducens TaxID=246191 RepID=A0A1G9E6U2_9BACT|nr:PTS sugar transporter subunit IIC [Maridesulfovibrio ferrireducens]SDK71834.1 PTS system, mannose-specific IIC component [Maridesulfovibrio ferrireducens]